MDTITTIHVLAQMERELDAELQDQNAMTRTRTPRLAALAGAYDKLIFNVEADAEKAHNKIAGTDARRPTVMAKVTEGIDAINTGLDDIGSAFDALMGDNGPPLESSGSASTSSDGQPVDRPTKPQS